MSRANNDNAQAAAGWLAIGCIVLTLIALGGAAYLVLSWAAEVIASVGDALRFAA